MPPLDLLMGAILIVLMAGSLAYIAGLAKL
jgi:hypothetical protein